VRESAQQFLNPGQSSLIIDLGCSRLLSAVLRVSAVRFLFSHHRINQMSRSPNFLTPRGARSSRLKHVILKRAAAFAANEGPKAAKPTLPALCLRPTARPPPGIDDLLQTKGDSLFDRAVTERSNALFSVLQSLNPVPFQPFFLVPAVRSAEGRKPLQLPCTQRQPSANRQQP
jgi:hypothetical protein